MIQEHSRVGYVFAGSQTRRMTDMIMKADQPFYRLGASRFVGPLPRADFSRHLKRNFRRSGFSVADKGAIERILDHAAIKPRHGSGTRTQLLLENWNRCLACKRSLHLLADPPALGAETDALVPLCDNSYYQDVANLNVANLGFKGREVRCNRHDVIIGQFCNRHLHHCRPRTIPCAISEVDELPCHLAR